MIAFTQYRATPSALPLPGKIPAAGSVHPAPAGGSRRSWVDAGLLGIGLLVGLLFAHASVHHAVAPSAAVAPASVAVAVPVPVFSTPVEVLSGIAPAPASLAPAARQRQIAAQTAALHEVLDDLGPILSSP